MSRIVVSLVMLVLFLPLIPGEEGGEPGRAGVDLTPEIQFPMEGIRIESEGGLRVNVSVVNIGDQWANGTATVNMKIVNRQNGLPVYTPLSQSVSGIPPNGSKNVYFSNWSQASPGAYRCEVTTSYIGDSNFINNEDKVRFSMFSKNWTDPPKLLTWEVDPLKGNTFTIFTYTVQYVYDKMPDSIKVEIDGVNHTMSELDPSDQITEDGKDFVFETTLEPGNHEYRFLGEVDDEVMESPDPKNHTTIRGPWVNVTLRYATINPWEGYVTSSFDIKINYGSTKNLPPDEIYVTIHGERFNLTRYSQTPIYTSGNVEYIAKVKGFDMIPAPLDLTFHCSVDGDEISYGPFRIKGPSMSMGNLTGNVTDSKGVLLEGATVSLRNGPTVVTGPDGRYDMRTYEGRQYTISCSKEGYYNTTYKNSANIYGNENTTINFVLESIPEKASVTGWVFGSHDGETYPLEGALVTLTGPGFEKIVESDSEGEYGFTGITPGRGFTLKATSGRFMDASLEFDIGSGSRLVKNLTLTEREQPVGFEPLPTEGPLPVDGSIKILFEESVNISTLDVDLMNGGMSIPYEIFLGHDRKNVTLVPEEDLLYNETYRIRINPLVLSIGEEELVWREIEISYDTEIQPPGGLIAVNPSPDSTDVLTDTTISVWTDIALDLETLGFELFKWDPIEVGVQADLVDFQNRFNLSRSNRSSCVFTVKPRGDLEYGKHYVLVINDTLRDLYGREVLDENFMLEFTTESEGDRDGDGFPDSRDSYPDDPSVAEDRDGDGYPDSWIGNYSGSPLDEDLVLDDFPDDPSAWLDTDGDGKPDTIIGESITGLEPDDDNDGDGMPNEWEEKYGLDPADPGDAYGDLDGDGVSNVVEYLDGTDPSDPSDNKKNGDSPSYALVTAGIIIILVIIAAAVIFFILRGKTGAEALEEE